MHWTRLALVVPLVAACGDDNGGDDAAGDTPVITTLPMTMTAPVTTGATEGPGESSGSASASGSTSEPTGVTTGGPTSAGPTSDPDETTSTTVVSTGETGQDTSTGEPLKFDMMPLPDIEQPVCLKCALTIASQQSGTFAIQGNAVFATAQLQGQIVYALGTYGAGRFIATADSSLPFNEVTDCPLAEWLAGNGGVQPKILYFGWGPQDGPKNWNVPADAADIHMPPQYIGNPAQLLADYDIVMYLEGSGQFTMDAPSDQEMQTLLDYMQMGGGTYLSSEFYGYMKDFDLVSVNRVLMPLGVTAEATNLDWGNVDGNIDFDCFPEPQ